MASRILWFALGAGVLFAAVAMGKVEASYSMARTHDELYVALEDDHRNATVLVTPMGGGDAVPLVLEFSSETRRIYRTEPIDDGLYDVHVDDELTLVAVERLVTPAELTEILDAYAVQLAQIQADLLGMEEVLLELRADENASAVRAELAALAANVTSLGSSVAALSVQVDETKTAVGDTKTAVDDIDEVPDDVATSGDVDAAAAAVLAGNDEDPTWVDYSSLALILALGGAWAWQRFGRPATPSSAPATSPRIGPAARLHPRRNLRAWVKSLTDGHESRNGSAPPAPAEPPAPPIPTEAGEKR